MLSVMNLILITVTMINIKTERFEKSLVDAEMAR